MRHVGRLLLGAGPTALGAAYRLKDLGIDDYLLVEKSGHVGGLAASFVDPAGFTWDIGGHVQFSHYDYFDRAMLAAIPEEGWLHHQRESWVWMRGRFVPYPFQNNIGFLPKEDTWDCLKGLIDVRLDPPPGRPADFEQWIRASFGDGVARHFMLPYNFKVWAYPPREMSYQWIGERVATVDLRRIVENVLFDKTDASWGPNNTFRFPGEGGTGAIWRSIGRSVGEEKILLDTEVVRVDPVRRVVTFGDGERVSYDRLLSTMPLDVLAPMVEGLRPETVDRARRLRHSSSNIIGIGVKGRPHDLLKTKCWMYFPESDCPFYRMTMFSNYSPRNVPDPAVHYSLMCEVSESPAKPVDRRTLVSDTLAGLYATGLLPRDAEVVSEWTYTADHGYPTPSLERDAILADVVPELDRLGVYSRGRFGGWKYEVSNQDHSFMQGVEWVDFTTSGAPEKTYRVDGSGDPNMTALKR